MQLRPAGRLASLPLPFSIRLFSLTLFSKSFLGLLSNLQPGLFYWNHFLEGHQEPFHFESCHLTLDLTYVGVTVVCLTSLWSAALPCSLLFLSYVFSLPLSFPSVPLHSSVLAAASFCDFFPYHVTSIQAIPKCFHSSVPRTCAKHLVCAGAVPGLGYNSE